MECGRVFELWRRKREKMVEDEGKRTMIIGCACYPEHWSRERWVEDVRLMAEAGFTTVRMAEFAWVKMEPGEGQYDFAWLDEALAVLSARGLKAILGTPSESMPVWLAKACPEALAVDREGHRLAYGARRDCCYTNRDYRAFAVRMAAAMADHYRDHPAIAGWQIDNELGGPFCFCAACEGAWRTHLRERFETIEALNERWGTIFWGHTYRSFEEVELPRRKGGNPSLELEHRRFHSRQVVAFQRVQADAIRARAPGQFITHNMCGLFLDETNYFDLAADLDVAGLDFYYNNSVWSNRHRVAAYESSAMDLTRSLKQKGFVVTETPAGVLGCDIFLRNLRPLEARRMAWQAFAHGAEGLLWFNWRSCRFGVEQLLGGVLDHDGVPGRHYEDCRRIAGELRRLEPELARTQVRPQVAILHSYDSRWAFNVQPNARGFSWVDHLGQYHRAFRREGADVGFVTEQGDFTPYRILVLPCQYLVTEELAARLESFVAGGGTLLVTTRSGVKDADNVCHEQVLPGPLRKLLGVSITEIEAALEPTPFTLSDGATAAGVHFIEGITPEGAEVLARWKPAHLSGFAAITRHAQGPGRAYYIGTCFADEAALRKFVAGMLREAGVATPVAPPDGVMHASRVADDGTRLVFLLNHNDEPAAVELGSLRGRELLSGREVSGRLDLSGGEVAIVRVPGRGA